MDKHHQDYVVSFGHDWPYVITACENRHQASVSESVMTVLPAPGPDSHSISTALLNRIVQLSQSGKRGVPFDLALAAWGYANGVALDAFSQNGAPRVRLGEGLTILFSEPNRGTASIAETQTKPPKRKRRRATV